MAVSFGAQKASYTATIPNRTGKKRPGTCVNVSTQRVNNRCSRSKSGDNIVRMSESGKGHYRKPRGSGKGTMTKTQKPESGAVTVGKGSTKRPGSGILKK